MEEEGSEKICVHEEDEEEEEDVQGGGRVAEEGMYLFLHCWKGGGCLQLGWFGSCCKEDQKQHTKLYHTVYCSPHKQSK